MKSIKSLIAVACVLAVLGAVTARAESCCDKAKAKGEACAHPCCKDAAKAGKTCEKCNPKKEEKK
jgi:hypothetical protein